MKPRVCWVGCEYFGPGYFGGTLRTLLLDAGTPKVHNICVPALTRYPMYPCSMFGCFQGIQQILETIYYTGYGTRILGSNAFVVPFLVRVTRRYRVTGGFLGLEYFGVTPRTRRYRVTGGFLGPDTSALPHALSTSVGYPGSTERILLWVRVLARYPT